MVNINAPFWFICNYSYPSVHALYVTRPATIISSLVGKLVVNIVISLQNCIRYRDTKNSRNSSSKFMFL